jgi:hypothetical protein
MDRKAPISDATISRNVSRQLAGRGLRSPCQIQVQTRNGEVTLSGTVQYVHQRDAAVQAIRTVEGVRRIVEKLKVSPPAKHRYPESAAKPLKPPAVDATQAEPKDAAAETPPDVSNESDATSNELPAPDEQTLLAAEGFTDFSLGSGDARTSTPQATTASMPHSRKGESYTFECSSPEEAERLRVVLAAYADWFKKNSWVGASKPTSGVHRVTFHAKSVIEFLRQEGF